MSFLDGNILKLPEQLLSKGEQNQDHSLELGRTLALLKLENTFIKSEKLSSYINFLENEQIVIGGKSRIKYSNLVTGWLDKQDFTGKKSIE